jgi:serine/threonine-protein kinase
LITIGETLGPYIVEAPLASGGMGAVFRARNRVTGQLRALKVVRADLNQEKDFVDRFVREATIASQLRHPNLVETLEPGIDGEIVYLPMELLVGETLAARLKRVQRFSPQDTAAVIVPVAEAVQMLHDRGVVHRDLKPANLFLARVDGREVPKVIDLGTARDVDDEHTRTGLVVGSPYYMAIEQAEGRRDIDGRADQYSLGVVAYQMITGSRPYESDDTRSAIAKMLRGDPFPPPSRVYPGINPQLEAVIGRALERDREHRFPTIGDFGRAFAMAANNQPLPADLMPMGQQPTSVATLTTQQVGGRPMVGGSQAAAPLLSEPTVAGVQPYVVGGPRMGGADLGAATVASVEGEENPLEAAAKQALAIAAAQGAQPAGAGGFAAPPPPAPAPAAQKSSRTMVIVAVVGLLLIVGIGLAAFRFWPQPAPEVAVPLGPATTVAVPPTTTVPTTVPATIAAPVTGVIAPPVTGVIAPPITGIPASTVLATTVPATTVPATTVPATTVPATTVRPTTVPATSVVPHTAVPTTTVPPTRVTPPPTRTSPPSTSTHTRPDGDHSRHPRGGDAPCGAATGIPCLE